MKRTLLVLRHAKAAGERGGADDFVRPLAKRGEREAAAVGKEMGERGWAPDLILCSTARRARETAKAVLDALEMPETESGPGAIRYEDRLYGAPLEVLTDVVAACPARVRRLLIVGHNPGLEELVEYLADGKPPRKPNGKLLTTAALACLETDAPWRGLGQGGAHLSALLRH